MKRTILIICTMLVTMLMSAQDFVNLSSTQMRIDSLLPESSHLFVLPQGYQDSIYTVELFYPEFTPLTKEEAKSYARITGSKHASEMPVMHYDCIKDRKTTMLRVKFAPIVEHKGRLCYVSSYKPNITSVKKEDLVANSKAATLFADAADDAGEGDGDDATDAEGEVYASSSVLNSGKWAKIKVSSTGIYRLTSDVIRKAGFSDLSKVKIYGYGGALVPEQLTQEYLREYDDLKEVATCTVGGEKFFYAKGPVSWSDKTTTLRTRNPYSDYGCYFITQNDDDALAISEEELLALQQSSNNAYHYLYEKDGYAWEQIGRNLVENASIVAGKSKNYEIIIPKGNTKADFRLVITTASSAGYSVSIDDSVLVTNSMKSVSDYDKAVFRTMTFSLKEGDFKHASVDANGNYVMPITVECTSGGPLRLDYLAASFATPAEADALGSKYPVAEYVYNITNQNHHADEPVDLVIIIPTSQNTLAQAEQIADLHRKYDNMKVRIVPADELYNEFSSGTPDVSAYRRYLKMFYDKDDTEDAAKMVKYCLLFGDCVWDNRMLTLPSASYNPDNYLLGYQTENSYNLVNSIVGDDFIGILQDGMTIHADGFADNAMQVDVAVGRLPVVGSTQAQTVVDKIYDYMTASPNGAWQNDIMFIGDDGDNNSHMRNINICADEVRENAPGYSVKKVMFDAYEKTSTSTGDRYPDVENIVRAQQKEGALIMNYGGHATWSELAHEKILQLSDFETFSGDNYSLWITAACETVPFSSTNNTIGEAAVLNADGGAIAFIGAVGTVYEELNSRLNRYLMRYLLSYDADGKPMAIGEALRMAKNSLVRGTDTSIGTDNSINKHHYHVIGDPAMHLALPVYKIVIDSIDGKSVSDEDVEEEIPSVKASSIVRVVGHVENMAGEEVKNFNGTANVTVKDSEQTIECRGQADANTNFVYNDYDANLFVGKCSVTEGVFSLTFRVPREIYDEGGTGLITVYARDPENMLSANGETSNFYASGWEDVSNNMVGPSISAYLNSPSFTNGGDVGATPYFVAEVSDNDGINVSDAAVGHNMELVVDGDVSMTYDLTPNFQFDNDSYTKGQTYYVLPSLAAGTHSLKFRAWDLLGNSNTVELTFRVTKGKMPEIKDVAVGPNPVSGVATFYVTHDMQGSQARVCIDIIDMMGRLAETLQWDATLSETSPTTSYRWNTLGVSPGMYLYRVRLSANGSDYVSKTKKLIVKH